MSIYFVKAGDTIWNIAKKFKKTQNFVVLGIAKHNILCYYSRTYQRKGVDKNEYSGTSEINFA